MEHKTDKRMSAQEAIAEFVHDGDELIIGNYTLGMAALWSTRSCGREKRAYPLFPIGHLVDEVLVAGGCVDRLSRPSWSMRAAAEGGSAVAAPGSRAPCNWKNTPI